MTCWHCNKELDINYEASDYTFKFYHCSYCDKWYEMRKEKVKHNAAAPVRFDELKTAPQIPLAA
jgi:hypothetical protein